MFGLDPDTVRNIKQVFTKIPAINKVILYGSRAKGNYRNGSDIDITLFGENLALDNSVYPLMDELEELNLPYMFDISIFADIDNDDLIEHIHRVGKVFYQREKGLPDGWVVKELGDVCDIFNGLWKGKKPPYIEVGVIRNTNFTKDGYLDDSNIAFLPVETKQFEKKKLEYGDIILEKSGGGPKQPVGRVIPFVKYDGSFSFSNFTSVVRIVNKGILDFNFLHRVLFFVYVSGKTEPMQRQSTGIRNLQLKEYKQIQIPLPPLPEQKRIVAILDQAFTAIDKAKANTEQNLKNAREVFQSTLQTIFDNGKLKIENGEWEEKKLGEIALVEYGYTDKSTVKGDYRYIRITDIDKNGELVMTDKKYIKSSEESEKFVLDNNDLLMARTGATFAKVLLYKDYETSVFASYLIRIKFTEKIKNELYWYFAKTQHYWEQANVLSSGAAQPHFNGVALKKVVFSYPKSVSEQKLLIKKFEKISTETKKLEANYQQKTTDLDELKKSILQKTFRGEL